MGTTQFASSSVKIEFGQYCHTFEPHWPIEKTGFWIAWTTGTKQRWHDSTDNNTISWAPTVTSCYVKLPSDLGVQQWQGIRR